MNKQKIQLLIDQGDFNEALQAVEELEAVKDLNLEDKLACVLLKSQILTKSGETIKGLDLASEALETVQDQIPDNKLLLVDAIITKAESLRMFGQYDPAYAQEKLSGNLKLVEQGERILESPIVIDPIEISCRKAVLLRNKGIIYRSLKEFDLSEDCFQKCAALYRKTGNKKELIEPLLSLAFTKATKGELDLSLETFNECLALQEEIRDGEGRAETLAFIAGIYQEQGKPAVALEYYQKSQLKAEELPKTARTANLLFDIALAHHFSRADADLAFNAYQKSLSIFKELNNKNRIAWCYIRLGNIYHVSRGELDKALDYYEMSIPLFEETGDKMGRAFPVALKGFIHHQRGDLDLALVQLQKGLALIEEIGQDLLACEAIREIGSVLRAKGDNNAAIEHYMHCLKRLDERKLPNDPYAEALTYLELISAFLDTNDLKSAKDYFERFNKYYDNNKHRSQYIVQCYKLSEALILKTSARIRDKAKAQQILQELVDDDTMGILDPKTYATLTLCELHLFELKASPDEVTEENETFQEIKLLINNLESLAWRQHSFPLLISTMLLQAKLALIEGNLTEAMQLLEQAKITTEEKKLARLVEKVVEEQKELSAQLDTWKNLVRENTPLLEKLEHARLEDYITKALKTVQIRQNPVSQ